MTGQTELSPQVDRDLVAYRSLSAWAAVALLLGLLSATAVLGPLLWLIPATGIIVSAIALWRIRAASGQLLGRGMALLGLLLAIFFAASGPARTLTRQYWLEIRAEHFAQGFVDLLQNNKPYQAHQLTKSPISRKPLAAGETEPYAKDEGSKKDYDSFLKLEPVKRLLDEGKKAKVELTSAHFVASDDREDVLEVGYHISGPDGGANQPLAGQMYLARTLAYGSGNEEWQIVPPAMRVSE